MLVEPVLADLDFTGGDGVLAFVNGMGGTPLLELYLMYGEVARDPGEGRGHGRPLAGRLLHHQPGHGRLLGHAAQGGRRAAAALGRARSSPPACGGGSERGRTASTSPRCGGGCAAFAAVDRRAQGRAHRPRRRDRRRRPRREHGPRACTAVVAALDAAPSARPGALLKQVGMTLVQHGRRGQRPAVRHVLPAHGDGLGPATGARRRRRSPQALRAGLDGVVARGKAERGRQDDVRRPGPGRDALDAALAAGAPWRRAARRPSAAADAGPRRDRPAAWPARAGPATSASAASGTRTRARPRPRCWSPPRRAALSDVTHDGRDRGGLAQPGARRGRGRAGRARCCTAERRRIEVAAGPRRRRVRHRRRRDRDAITGPTAATGVVVLMDLGSAVLSRRARAGAARRRRCAAASCSARRRWSRGWSSQRSPRCRGRRRARSRPRRTAALAGQAGPPGARPNRRAGPTSRAQDRRDEATAVFTVTMPHGLHARPAALVVQAVRASRRRRAPAQPHRGHRPSPRAACRRSRRSARCRATSRGRARRAAGRRGRGRAPRPGPRRVRRGRRRRRRRPRPAAPASGAAGPVPAPPGIGIGPARPLRDVTVDLPDDDAADAATAGEWRAAAGRRFARSRQDVARRCATGPPPRSARPRPRSSTPTCCCSTTRT